MRFYGLSLCDIGEMTLGQMNELMDEAAWVHNQLEGVDESKLPAHERTKRAIQKQGGRWIDDDDEARENLTVNHVAHMLRAKVKE